MIYIYSHQWLLEICTLRLIHWPWIALVARRCSPGCQEQRKLRVRWLWLPAWDVGTILSEQNPLLRVQRKGPKLCNTTPWLKPKLRLVMTSHMSNHCNETIVCLCLSGHPDRTKFASRGIGLQHSPNHCLRDPMIPTSRGTNQAPLVSLSHKAHRN